ncbi:thiamine phosphate synthase [Parvibaculum sp.]|uniref:thiamine phosphate synthase n=1 Tax=Parvibaculum sp. TaxID=2024848 RepID=UPI002731B0EA|nr:thiamine phosphate synthase [Parvibaculum sp.]MDP1625946.1 thiamine phosphate synthase [Parvibaculum sp.]MDP2149651.1 thiamine phosphate synthase [Parvibaculum sp.]MDP3329607.1 thiamine phosphate synthase [Parvibaculum sp.]
MDEARTAWRSPRAASTVALIGVTDPVRLPDPLAALVALPRGGTLIWRAYGAHLKAVPLRRLSAAARMKGCLLLVAGHPRCARWLGVQGLHLPEYSVGKHFEHGHVYSLRDLPPGFVITAACHSEAAIHAAARAGVNAVLISPVFPTASHPGAKTLGVVRFARLARLARALGMAPYALGGIASASDMRRLSGSGAAGIAGVSLLLP